MESAASLAGQIVCAGTLLAMAPTAALSQEPPVPFPGQTFLLTGYGFVMYDARVSGPFGHDFTLGLSPVLLFQSGSDILFSTEFEVEFEEGEARIGVEYAKVSYQGFERLQVTAGKFLLPFGLFGERFHPAWINKLPGPPLLYGEAHGGVAEDALLPILSDVGILARFAAGSAEGMVLDLSVYVTQGPGTADEEGPAGIPLVAFGTAFGDRNNNKLVGARFGLVQAPRFEVFVSGFTARYDDADDLAMSGANLAAEFRNAAWELRGEAVVLRQEMPDGFADDQLSRRAYYAQVARRLGGWEAVLRWSHLPEAELGMQSLYGRARELAIGVDYWLDDGIPIKLAYGWRPDGADGLSLQWALVF